ncbi:MAG: Glu-tRNA(Gln) amidotransferase subunit GatE [Ignavibacteria bacterium]|nr:Glu-tRNA(Gln) amidotransferase subunit GatE [Ignavibacteria bacterium]
MIDFIFKPFEEMTDEDYARIGFKSGLEVHQQLDTEKKLFCRCPSGKYSKNYNAEILRHMRPTLSELGEYDGTALMEFKTKKNIIYRIHHDSVCTYEMDDTPPFMINEEALDKAIAIGILMNCSIIDELHIARKQYLDGSIPTGFQRTAIFGVNGWIKYKDRKINIIQISIEEDSCREISDIGHNRYYNTDRLGMPLIETVTAPEMRTPFEVMEVCEILSALVRSTGLVRTGAGAAREDVNVSVEGGTRIEIKGVPSIKRIPILTYNEAMRQWNLLRLREELHRRGITPDTFKAKVDNVTKCLRKTKYEPIKNALKEGLKINCVTLCGFKDLLRWQTQTNTYFAKEISDRVRVIACLTTLPNIIHSDSASETISNSEWQTIKKVVGAQKEDTLVIVWGDEKDAETGANEIIIRAREATIGVPSETRQALKDGTNGFERILPGPDRMYPDTDLPPEKITIERVNKLKQILPEPIWEREEWYRELKIPNDVIRPLAISKFANLFKKLVKDFNINPKVASIALIHYPKRIKKKLKKSIDFTEEVFLNIFELFKKGVITREGILLEMMNYATNGTLSSKNPQKIISDKELSEIIQESKAELERLTIINPDKKTHVLMGIIMNKVRGKIDGSKVYKLIKEN